MNQFKKTAIAMGVAQIALLASGAVMAQEAAKEPALGTVVVVTGQRAALNSAQKIKQNADEVVDSIVADDIGKLPDRSVTEVLQRIVGVTIDRTMSKGDPEHFSVEGSGVTVRGLTYVRSELNGRDSFSANGGRALNFGDVPPELMAGVDVYKNPSAEQIEGSIGGLVNLRTAMPFDSKGFRGAVSFDTTYSELKKGKMSPGGSFLISDRWKTGFGEFGALIDVASSESGTRTDAFQVEPYYPRTVDGKRVWIPKGAQWRTLQFDRKREGLYGALQWKLGNTLRSSLTYFKSKYQMGWDEQAIFSGANAYNITPSADSTYDPLGAFQTGTLRADVDGGINFGNDTRIANRKSSTTDISWNVEWRPSPSWTVSADLQSIKAKTVGVDSTVATSLKMPKQKVDLTGSIPNLMFDDFDRAYIADPKNYYWAFTMEHLDRSVANEKALRTDVKYDFDHPVLRDVRFGVRFTDRDSDNIVSVDDYHWRAITQPWQVGWNISGLAYLGDPRFGGETRLHTFPNFFNGKVSVPSVVFPTSKVALGYPETYAQLHTYHDILCREVSPTNNCEKWTPASFGTDPIGRNVQAEKTKAFFTQLRFGFDDWKYPVDGNIGIRYVQTNMTAAGYTNFSPSSVTVPPGYATSGPAIPDIPRYSQARDYDKTYHNVLPSLNLRMKYSPELQFRVGMSSGLSRPDFGQMQGYTGLSRDIDSTTDNTAQTFRVNSVTLKGTAKGNPFLEPVTSRQIDLTAEWYFNPVGSVTVAVFNKQLKDIIVNQLSNYPLPDVNGKMYDFVVTSPVNGAKGKARGFEVAYQQYFDKLPGWMSGIGMQANFTFVDSSTKMYNPVFSEYCSSTGNNVANLNLNMNGCDTDGRTFGNLPLQGLSRRSANLALMYDKGPLSSRLAYSWRSKHLQAVNVNGTNGGDGLNTNPASATFGATNLPWALPTWADDYGQLDGGISYKFGENLSFGFEAQNLTDAKFKQLMQQGIGMKGRAWFSTGRRYTAQMTYRF